MQLSQGLGSPDASLPQFTMNIFSRSCLRFANPSGICKLVVPRKVQYTSVKSNADDSQVAPKIYTKTGDGGTSSLFTGERRHKSDLIFDAMGDVDEISCHIGLSKNQLNESWQNENFKEIALQFEKIQCTLQDVNSCIATPLSSASEKRLARTRFDSSLTKELEDMIDDYTAELPVLKNFIIPSGGLAASQIHVTRSVCRRAERKVSTLISSGDTPSEVGQYLNRLSDFFFTAARYVAMMEGHTEKIYKKPKVGKQNLDDIKENET